jgi:hypothetical protein
MRNWFERSSRLVHFAKQYPVTFYGGLKNRELFEEVKTFCVFIGYPRSGHSLIGSLLDAHPNMLIAHEVDALKYFYFGFGKNQIFQLILENSSAFTQNGRQWNYYSYRVPNQWQGKFQDLRVIGDKQGEGTTLRFKKAPFLLEKLQRVFQERIKFIHVIRNPYDNITTISLKTKRHRRTLEESIDYYFSLAETVAALKSQMNSDNFFEMRHELFIENPHLFLNDLCRFLGVEASDGYLKDCASITFKSSKKSRLDAQWTPELIDLVKTRMDSIDFLNGYSFEE